MLHNLKKNLFEILVKIDKNITINIDDIEVETLFDQRGDFTTNTCLLYTSPSPRDRTRSRMPSSA